MTHELYAWSAEDDLDVEEAQTTVDAWVAAGADPAAGPFAPSTDVAWFYRELTKDLPDIDAVSDGAPNTSGRPIWLSTGPCRTSCCSPKASSPCLGRSWHWGLAWGSWSASSPRSLPRTGLRGWIPRASSHPVDPLRVVRPGASLEEWTEHRERTRSMRKARRGGTTGPW